MPTGHALKYFIAGTRACYTAIRYRLDSLGTGGMGSVRRSFVLALLCIWILTTGSTCQSSYQGSHFQAQGNGAGVIVVVLVAVAVSCLTSPYGCGDREPMPFDRVQMTFESGVGLIKNGSSSGLDWICLAGHQGYAKAQYYYGVHLFRHDPTNSVESLVWLKHAAAQDHKAARHMLSQMTDWRREAWDAPALRPLAVAPPALRACVTRPGAEPLAPVLEAMGSQYDARG